LLFIAGDFYVVLAAFSAVGVPFKQFSNRMSITMTLLLTIVAFKFVVGTYVPPTPYLTLLDKYVISAFLLMGAVILENFIVSFAPSTSSTFVHKADFGFAFILSTIWILFHFFVVLGTYNGLFFLEWEEVRKIDTFRRKDVRKLASVCSVFDRRRPTSQVIISTSNNVKSFKNEKRPLGTGL
jgi:hypothetical protein